MSLTRRHFLTSAGVAGGVLAGGSALASCTDRSSAKVAPAGDRSPFVAFDGDHQAGVTTPTQQRLLFVAFDALRGATRSSIADTMRVWTALARDLTQGRRAGEIAPADPNEPPEDNGEAIGLPTGRLTITFGFGRTLFVDADGVDRFGLADRLPAALIDIPGFGSLDSLDPARSNGDIGVQICCDDPQVAFHAMHHLARLAKGTLTARWSQLGFGPSASTSTSQATPRNLLGFKDGTNNLKAEDTEATSRAVWVSPAEGPDWMVGGTYQVTRRIRLLLETWDRASLTDQEATIGRHKANGAPLGGTAEFDPIDLEAKDSSGRLVVPIDAHVRLARPEVSGVEILRRGYNFTDGIDPITGQIDSGLFFIAFQRDATTQFVALQRQLTRTDALNEYIKHTSSALFAVPPGVTATGWIGEGLFT